MKLSLPPVERTTLGSGLEIICVTLPSVGTGVAELVSDLGSRHDPDDLGGVSHFLEHMLYRGTRSHPGPHELALAFESRGGSLEAATAVDSGSLSLAIPAENLTEALPLLGEVFSSPLLEDIEVERGIVREEILESLDEKGTLIDPGVIARQLCFGDHPLGRPITGSMGALQRFTEPVLRAFHRDHYVSAACVLALAGPFRLDEVVDALERGFGALPHGERPRAVPPPDQCEPRFQMVRYTGSQTAIELAFRAPGLHDPMEASTELLLSVLDDGMSTRLYHRICNTLGLCYEVGASYEAWEDAGIVEITAESAHDRTETLVVEILEVLRRLCDDGPTAEEVARAKRRAVWQLRELLDDPAQTGAFYASAALFDTARDPAARAEQLGDVTMDKIRTAAQRLFVSSAFSLAAVGQLPKRVVEQLERRVSEFR